LNIEAPVNGSLNYKDRSRILVGIGLLMLLVGIVAAFMGPVEMYCFYLFSQGGRLHYEGFGFGSFMFGNIACQIIGYYVIAAVFIPLGYGHMRMHRWARTVSLTLLWFWLVVGLPLTIVFLLVLITAKELTLFAVLITVVFLLSSYSVIPGLLIRFYQSQDVRLTFAASDAKSYGIEGLPLPILVLCALFLFYTIALHIPIFFNGIFPLFGLLLFNLEGFFLIDVSITCLVLLLWGTARQKTWAWWGSVAYFSLLTSSLILTFPRSSLSDILSGMRFAPIEMEALQGVPLEGSHLAVFFGLPLVVTLGLVLFSKRHFTSGEAKDEAKVT
jgi:hypothetical protein